MSLAVNDKWWQSLSLTEKVQILVHRAVTSTKATDDASYHVASSTRDIVSLLEAEAESDAQTRIKLLEAALKPFVDGCEQIERDYGDDLPGFQYQFFKITMDELRAAKAALKGTQ